MSPFPAKFPSPRLPAVNRLSATFYAMRFVSQAGQGVFLAGLFLLAGSGSRAAAGTSSLLVAMMAASLLGGLPAGSFADQIGPAISIRIGAAGRALSIALALLVATGMIPGPAVLLVAVIAFVYSATSQLYSPAEMALVSAVETDRPARAHATLVALQHIGQGIGVAVIAPLMLWTGGVPAALGAAFGLYVGVVFLAFILSLQLHPARSASVSRHRYTLKDTFRYFTRDHSATHAALLLAFGEIAAKTMAVAVPIYVAHEMPLERIQQIALAAAGVAGAGAGLLWAGHRLHHYSHVKVMRMTLMGTVTSMIALAAAGHALAGSVRATGLPLPGAFGDTTDVSFAVAVPVAFLLGICFAVGPIGARAVLTHTAPAGQQARVFAMQGTFTDSLVIVPLMLAGAGTQLAGAWATFVFVAFIGIGVLAVLELPRLVGNRTAAPLAVPVEVHRS